MAVPLDNILLGEGRGLEIAQGRLRPGRIHHCMRLIGMAERAVEAMKARAKSRVAFGKALAEQGTIQEAIAQSRIEIEQARLLTLKGAHTMDTVGNKAAKTEIGMIKVVAPNMAISVLDRAVQIHGAAGLSSDFGLASALAFARSTRFVDGPGRGSSGVDREMGTAHTGFGLVLVTLLVEPTLDGRITVDRRGADDREAGTQ